MAQVRTTPPPPRPELRAEPSPQRRAPETPQGWRYNLAGIPWVRRMLAWRGFQPALILPNLFFFTVIIMAGLVGTPVGNRNFAIIFVWIVWWAALIMLLIPFASRLWCAMCPIPAPGEWLQRKAIVGRTMGKLLTLNWKWPKKLRGIWLQNGSFLAVAMFSAIILTRPVVTSWVLITFFAGATVLYLLYPGRAFCRYVCPVGGFIGLYSMAAPLEIRSGSRPVCNAHKEKSCILGSALSYGCPWYESLPTMNRNAYCGMCTECFSACDRDNVALNLRPFGTDLLVPKRHMDEAYKAHIMLVAAVVYTVVMTGPWGWLRDWANMVSWPGFITYALGFLAANLLVSPGLLYLAGAAGRGLAKSPAVPLKKVFISYSYTLVPLGLAAWIAFSIGFVLVNISYAIPLISDPFGWGWDLFGTRSYPWTPYLPDLVPYLQLPVLLVGLAWSLSVARHISRELFGAERGNWRTTIPVGAFLTLAVLALIALNMG